MCYECYKEYGSPEEISERTKAAAALIDRVYESSCLGGNLHIIVDDWNLEDGDMEFCEWAIEENTHKMTPEAQQTERECLSALRAMDLDGRASAMAIHEEFI